jgi:hypothetical protein
MNASARIALLVILLINLLQAAFTQLTGDEALYWMYWENLDWGYRDHPPTIGILIGLGYSIFENEFGARLFIALANTATIYLLWRLVKPTNWLTFFLLIVSIPVMMIYGFIATPDAPLMLGTVVYLSVWKHFIEKPDLKNSLWLGISMAFLMWCKYHGIFIIIFSLLPVRSLWFDRHYWLAAIVGILLFSPHLIWQGIHDLPTVKFHLNERNSDAWDLRHIFGYLGGQLLVFNPVVLGYGIYLLIKTKAQTSFEKSIRWLFVVMISAFFINSFRGRVEPHWTAPLALVLIYLFTAHWKTTSPAKWLKTGLVAFAVILLAVRFFMVFDILPGLHKEFHRNRQKMTALHELVGEKPVCFMNSYQNPSLYSFYTGGIAHSINNTEGGKNQFDFWCYADAIDHNPCVIVASYDHPDFPVKTINSFDFRVREFHDLPVAHKLKIRTDEWLFKLHPGDSLVASAWLINGNSYSFQLRDTNYPLEWTAYYNHKKPKQFHAPILIDGLPSELMPGDSARVKIRTVVPQDVGTHKMSICLQIGNLPGTYQSNWMRIELE